MINDFKKDAEERMKKAVEVLGHNFNKIRTGRAHPSLLDTIRVNYYGSEVPLSQVANIGVEDARTLTVSPWERNMVPDVEKGDHEIRSRSESEHRRHRDSYSDAAAH